MIDLIRRFHHDTSAATAIEYCFIAGLIAMAIVGGMTTVGVKINRFFLQIAAVN